VGVVSVPESPFGPGQPADDHSIEREHAQPPAPDRPTSDSGVGVQTPPPDRSGVTAAEADARDIPGQQEAATPEPGSLPAAAERLATLPLRLLAFAVDLACVVAVLIPLILAGILAGIGSLGLFTLVVVACLLTYLTVWVWLSGQTVGKAVFNLTVRRIDDTAPARTWRGLVWSLGRHSVGYVIADVFGLGVLAALTPPRRCLHDYAFGSKVVIHPTSGDRRPWSPVAQLNDLDERLDASIEDRGKRYARVVALWKKLTRLVRYPALLVIVLAGKNPESPLGRLWGWAQRQISRLLEQAQSAVAPPARALTAWARAGLWAVTGSATLAVAVAIAPVILSPPVITDDFDTNAEGWAIVEVPNWGISAQIRVGTRLTDAAWAQSGGNPGGMLQHRDQTGGAFYFAAPDAFLRDVAAAYGRQLSFDLRVIPNPPDDTPFDSPDVVLQGAGQTLVIDAVPPAPTAWTRVQVRLNETAGWKQGALDGGPATRQQILAVLGGLTALWIRGDMYNRGANADQASLDNVQLGR
jgi:uncharacterized RDD family membrane protein YckC